MSKKKDFTVSLKLSESNTLPVLAELISSNLKMETICSSETSVKTQRVKLHNIPEDVNACRFWLNLFLPPARWRRYVPPKRRLKLNGLNGVIFQKTLLLAGFG
jgi:hypothetical protein